MDESFSLQVLHNFVHLMLSDTERTKKTLEMECEEAKFALKPWLIESTVVRQLDKNICSCEEGLMENPEEIAEEIAKTLLHAQQLREKLAVNLNKERRESRKPSTREIYTRAPPPLKEANTNAPRSKSQHRSVSQQRPAEEQRRARLRSVSSVRNVGNENARESARTRLPAWSQFRISGDNDLARLTSTHRSKASQPNFILANKLSVRSANNKSADKRPPKCLLEKSRKSADGGMGGRSAKAKSSDFLSCVRSEEMETLGKLNSLIKTFATSTRVSSSSARDNCPIHAKGALNFVEEKVVTSVDAVEGLDRIGVPGNLLNILKTYHAFVRLEVFRDAKMISKKQPEAANNFLSNLEAINRKKNRTDLSTYHDLLNGFSLLYRDSFNSNLNKAQLKELRSQFKALQLLYDDYNIKQKSGELTFLNENVQYDEFIFDTKNWLSNGIWNYLCIPNMKGIFGSQCTIYSDNNQLICFYDFIQKIQRKTYEMALIELLTMMVIPKLKELFDPTSHEFIKIYKMIVTMIQILNPTVPVLAKTESED